MSLLTGILVLVLVCAASVSLAAATGRDAAVFPLPIFARGGLPAAGRRLPGHAAGGAVALLSLAAGGGRGAGPAGRAGAPLAAKNSAGLKFFAAASLVIWVLFAVLQPMFVEWDEFTFWGMAAKLLKEKNVLYPADPANLRAVSGLPGLGLVSYFVQGFAADFWRVAVPCRLRYAFDGLPVRPPRRCPAAAGPTALRCWRAARCCLSFSAWCRRARPAPSMPTPWPMCRWRFCSAGRSACGSPSGRAGWACC